MSDDSPLLLAVEALTKPRREKVIQDAPEGIKSGPTTVTIELPSLLEQLDQSILGEVGIGGSGSLASERNMLDGAALEKLREIQGKVNGWARMADALVAPKDAGATLKSWYAKFVQRTVSPEVELVYLRELWSWANMIEAKIDPPKINDLPQACPVCDATEWWDPATKARYFRPLVIQYRAEGADTIQNAKGLCRACAHVWTARELAYALEVAESDTPQVAI